MDPEIIVQALVTLGAAWGGVKHSLNGMRASVKRIETKVDKIDETQGVHGERLASLEARNERKDS